MPTSEVFGQPTSYGYVSGQTARGWRVRLIFLPVLVAIGLETLARGLGVGF